MRIKSIAILASLMGLSACAHATSNTNQFYVAQNYLPLNRNVEVVVGEGSAVGKCVSGPVMNSEFPDNGRQTTKVLPGMMLRVKETNYSAVNDSWKPVMTSWQWSVPQNSALPTCSDGKRVMAKWDRDDLLVVRHMLSGATTSETQPNRSYFSEALAQACSGQVDIKTCLEEGFLDRFVNQLYVDVRLHSKSMNKSIGRLNNGFDPNIPFGVLSDANMALTAQSTGLGYWYNDLYRLKRDDLFLSDRQAELCSTSVNFRALDLHDSDVCRFSFLSLMWIKDAPESALQGATLKRVENLTILQTGDPLYLMQPPTHKNPLDIKSIMPCTGDDSCPIEKRMAAGFVNFELLIPIFIANAGGVYLDGLDENKLLLPVGRTVAEFEHETNYIVTKIKRSSDWLPFEIILDDGKLKAVKPNTHVSIKFSNGSDAFGEISIISARDEFDAKADFIFAPGDVITIKRRS